MCEGREEGTSVPVLHAVLRCFISGGHFQPSCVGVTTTFCAVATKMKSLSLAFQLPAQIIQSLSAEICMLAPRCGEDGGGACLGAERPQGREQSLSWVDCHWWGGAMRWHLGTLSPPMQTACPEAMAALGSRSSCHRRSLCFGVGFFVYWFGFCLFVFWGVWVWCVCLLVFVLVFVVFCFCLFCFVLFGLLGFCLFVCLFAQPLPEASDELHGGI